MLEFLKLKLLFHWLLIYIAVNILEYIVIHLALGWLFGSDKKPATVASPEPIEEAKPRKRNHWEYA